MYVNFILSSITFFQIYIPLIKYIQGINSSNFKILLFLRKNRKSYADPYIHKDQYSKLVAKYKLKLLSASELNKYPGVIICVDGDIYGPHVVNMNESVLRKIDRSKFFIFSFIENLNFQWSYHRYYQWVNYTILPNKMYEITYNLKGSNLYLGNPKYDITFNKKNIYTKHGLLLDKRYVLIFFPRVERGIKKYGPHFNDFLSNLYDYLHQMGFTILVKNRKKTDKKMIKKWRGDRYFVDVTCFPNTSMELLEVAEFVIFFGSAVIEEIVMACKPFMEFIFDDVNRFKYLRDKSYSVTCDYLPTKEQVENNIKSILANKGNYKFDRTIKEYLFNKEDNSKIIFNKMLELMNDKSN